MLALEILFNANTVFGILNMLGTIVAFIYFGVYKIARMELKVDTMWAFQMRRGMTEIEYKGLGVSRSPVEISEKAVEAIKPLVPELKELYKTIEGEKLPVLDLAAAIEERFGDRIAKLVCIPLNISDGACLVLAVSQLRPISYETISHNVVSLKDLPLKKTAMNVYGGRSFFGKK